MPSIFTHLIIAQDALESQAAGPGRAHLEANSAAYYLGALCPDLPYFDIFHKYRGLPLGAVLGSVSHTLESRVLAWLGWSSPQKGGWAQRLHSASTGAILSAWSAQAMRQPGAWVAVAAGMVTHYAADEVLHREIIAETGDGSTAESMRRHRELEINLDYVLLRSRGVAVESLSLSGLLEAHVGRVDQNGEYLSPSVKRAWVETSAVCDGVLAIRRGELDAWSRGFAGAMRLLEHPFSPMQQQKRRFIAGAEETWRTYFARTRYLSSHVPRAARVAEAELATVLRPFKVPFFEGTLDTV